MNEQYVPIGYRSTAYTTPPPSYSVIPSEPEPSDSSEPFLNPSIIIAVLVLLIGVIAVELFFYFEKGKRAVAGGNRVAREFFDVENVLVILFC